MCVDTLVRLVPPPAMPIESGTPDGWQAVEQRIGTPLPQDYKRLVNLYGIGYFGGYVCPLTPFVNPPGYLNLVDSGRDILNGYEQGRKIGPKYHPSFPAYPEPGGLLPWGRDDNAGVPCWLTQGQPDEWPVVILDSHYSQNYSQFALSATGFLVQWLSGQIRVSFYPEDTGAGHRPLFEPFQPPWKR